LSYATGPPEDTEVSITTSTSDPVEILFQIGLHETQQGNYPTTIKIFSSLAREAPSPRIQLELARALFLDRRYQESAEVFNDILARPDIPWTVQENIRAYLEAIDLIRRGIRSAASAASGRRSERRGVDAGVRVSVRRSGRIPLGTPKC